MNTIGAAFLELEPLEQVVLVVGAVVAARLVAKVVRLEIWRDGFEAGYTTTEHALRDSGKPTIEPEG